MAIDDKRLGTLVKGLLNAGISAEEAMNYVLAGVQVENLESEGFEFVEKLQVGDTTYTGHLKPIPGTQAYRLPPDTFNTDELMGRSKRVLGPDGQITTVDMVEIDLNIDRRLGLIREKPLGVEYSTPIDLKKGQYFFENKRSKICRPIEHDQFLVPIDLDKHKMPYY